MSNIKTTQALSAFLGVDAPKPSLLKRTEGKTDYDVEREKTVVATCGYHCGGKCPLQVHLKHGAIERITIHEDDIDPPLPACLKGLTYQYKVYAPTRLKYPLKRVGERGENRFKRISWEEALDTVAREMRRVVASYGPESIFECANSANDSAIVHRTIPGGSNPLTRLLNLLGGRTAFANSQSEQGGYFASVYTYGFLETTDANDPADLMNTKLIILWGKNPLEGTRNSAFPWYLKRCKKAGIRMIFVDPCYSDTAKVYADQWIPIRPNTDAAMAIAMAYVMITENLYDKAFIDKYTYGFDQYRDYVLGKTDNVPKTPEWAEKITGVPAAIIIALAQEYATTKPAALHIGFAPGRAAYGEQYHRAAVVLQAMTGNIGIHGGSGNCVDLYRGPLGPQYSFVIEETPEGRGKRWGGKGVEIKNGRWADAVMLGKKGGYPSNIKLIYVLGHNILTQRQNSKKGIAAMKKPEFIVCHEQFMTNTAKYADIVLPASTNFEWTEDDIYRSGNWMIFLSARIIEPLYGTKSDFVICTELAKRLGFAEKVYNPKSPDEVLRGYFDGFKLPLTYEDFKKSGIWKWQFAEPYVRFREQIEDPIKNPFPTPSGKIEIFSQKLASIEFRETWRAQGDKQDGYVPPIPTYIACEERLPNEKYPLQMCNAHHRLRVHSQLGNIPQLRRRYKHEVWINPADAAARGIQNGDLVRVFNNRGAIRLLAFVTDRIMKGVVRIYQGTWFDFDEEGIDNGGCVNVLINDELTSPGGASNFNTCLVEVRKEQQNNNA